MNTNIIFIKVFKLNEIYKCRICYNNKPKKNLSIEFDNDIFLSEILDPIQIINKLEEIIQSNNKLFKNYQIMINIIPYDLVCVFEDDDSIKVSEKYLEKRYKTVFYELENKFITDIQVFNRHKGIIYLIPSEIKEEYTALRNMKYKNVSISLDIFATNDYIKFHKDYFHHKRILLIIQDVDVIRLYRIEDLHVTGFIIYQNNINDETLDQIINKESYDEILIDMSDEQVELLVDKYQNQLIIDINKISDLSCLDYEKLLK